MFTGSLLAPPGQVAEHVILKNYLTLHHDLEYAGLYYIGLTKHLDTHLELRGYYYQANNFTAGGFGDLTFGFDFQLLDFLKLSVYERFPTGRYENLSAKKTWHDITGDGAYTTVAGLVFYQETKNTTFTASLFSFIPTNVNVNGFNTYGGGFGTDGTIDTGCTLTATLSGEYALSKRWTLALDVQYEHHFADIFTGYPGISLERTWATNGIAAFNHYALAPALEYNFNERFGIIAGAKVPLWDDSASALCNFNYAY